MVQLLREKRKKHQEDKVGKEISASVSGFPFSTNLSSLGTNHKEFCCHIVLELLGLVNSPRAMGPPGESPGEL